MQDDGFDDVREPRIAPVGNLVGPRTGLLDAAAELRELGAEVDQSSGHP
ncbi:hypothetical protein [Actinophytocola algeriensis]|uniref:Uncharacterized protein n=1 Tax=Actinophytocola algeriensis TaxID=1768010 RepID=A0A7W7Q850_9PSEU|nr:hypothetical protein [Actinophytocola algeriensis]MBB4908815.1 hypothetical protein [Actinophytocola algeriensis]MBE1474798.1 hypothetical protein [Actinophytocola algeriensis]